MHYNWISVTEDNYRQILEDVLHQTIRTKLKVIQYRGMSSFDLDASSRMGIGTQHNLYFPVGQTVNMGIGVMGGYALIKNGLICRTRHGFDTPYPHSCDIGSFDYGIQESIHYCNNEVWSTC